MLGRSIGLSAEQLRHLADDPLPEGVYSHREAAVVRYSQVSTRSVRIDGPLYADLEQHFSAQQIMELCLVVGMSNFTNRFHATFLTPVDQATQDALVAAGEDAQACALPISLDLP